MEPQSGVPTTDPAKANAERFRIQTGAIVEKAHCRGITRVLKLGGGVVVSRRK